MTNGLSSQSNAANTPAAVPNNRPARSAISTGRGRFEDRHDARGEQVRLQPATCGVMTDELLAHRVPARALPRGPTRDVRLSEQQRSRGEHLAERWVLRRAAQIVAVERGQAGGDLGAFVVGRTVGPRLVQREHQEERGRHTEQRDGPALRIGSAPVGLYEKFEMTPLRPRSQPEDTDGSEADRPRVNRWSTRAWA